VFTINGTTPPTLGTDVFQDNTGFNIKVPAAAVEEYIAAEGWDYYEDFISGQDDI